MSEKWFREYLVKAWRECKSSTEYANWIQVLPRGKPQKSIICCPVWDFSCKNPSCDWGSQSSPSTKRSPIKYPFGWPKEREIPADAIKTSHNPPGFFEYAKTWPEFYSKAKYFKYRSPKKKPHKERRMTASQQRLNRILRHLDYRFGNYIE